MHRAELLSGLTVYANDLIAAFKTHKEFGLKSAIYEHIEKLDVYSNLPLKIGVIGRSGTGKSSFINAVTGSTDSAEVGVIETTQTGKQYAHPRNRKLIFCDLPGGGTERFPLQTYCHDAKICIDTFDMMIVMFCTRFTESEIHFLLEVISQGMLCLFIRTKVALDIQNQRKAKRRHFVSNPEAVDELIKEIRQDCYKNIKDLHKDIPVYLIDNLEPDHEKLDFGLVTKRLLDGFECLKKEAFVDMCFHDAMRQIKEEKYYVGKQKSGQNEDNSCVIL